MTFQGRYLLLAVDFRASVISKDLPVGGNHCQLQNLEILTGRQRLKAPGDNF
jgi:hypothetical protein